MVQPGSGTMATPRYASDSRALLVLDTIRKMHQWDTIAVIDASMIAQDDDETVHSHKTLGGVISPHSSLIALEVAGGAIPGRRRWWFQAAPALTRQARGTLESNGAALTVQPVVDNAMKRIRLAYQV